MAVALGPARNGAPRHLSVWTGDTTGAPAPDAQVHVEPDADTATAVVAHGLLGNLAVVRGVARLLMGEPDLPEAERTKLLELLDGQVDLMQGVLADLIRGLPSQALAALDELRR